MQVSTILKVLEDKQMVTRAGAPKHGLAKVVEMTGVGLEAVRTALPLVIEVQRELFGDAGLPGGALLEALLAVDRSGAG
jgi:DNA-binding MarR family transcriptional regulator